MSLSLTFTNAQVLLPDGMRDVSLSISGGKICDQQGREVDLSGYMILPGIVDIHGDGFERHLAPRRGAMKDLRQGLASCDAELAANGITTAVLAQFYSWEGGMRGPDFARRFLASLEQEREGLSTDILVQLRFETHLLEHYSIVENLISQHHIPYVVFNDHLPHKALEKGKKPPRLVGQALKSGRSPEAHLQLLQELHARKNDVSEAIKTFTARLNDKGVVLGSHDDRTASMRESWRQNGVHISEFPETFEAADAARKGGDSIVLGAPNVVRGGSHSGNVSAAQLVSEGLCDALASDYHYPALRHACFELVAQGASLEHSWPLISQNPARLLNLTDRGQLSAGLRADLVVINTQTTQIEATLVKGNISYLSKQAAKRFLC